MKALVIDEDILYGRKIKHVLEVNRHKVTLTDNGQLAEKLAHTNQYDLVFISTLLFQYDTYIFIRNFRNLGFKTPIIVITNVAQVEERIKYLNLGADDYIDKTISSDELISRVMAMMRRANQRYTKQYEIGGLLFDVNVSELSSQNDILPLAPKESQCLEYLVINQNLTLTKEQLVAQIWGNTKEFNLNLVEVYISLIRKKLKQLGATITIQTVRNQGYVLKIDPQKMQKKNLG